MYFRCLDVHLKSYTWVWQTYIDKENMTELMGQKRQIVLFYKLKLSDFPVSSPWFSRGEMGEPASGSVTRHRFTDHTLLSNRCRAPSHSHMTCEAALLSWWWCWWCWFRGLFKAPRPIKSHRVWKYKLGGFFFQCKQQERSKHKCNMSRKEEPCCLGAGPSCEGVISHFDYRSFTDRTHHV